MESERPNPAAIRAGTHGAPRSTIKSLRDHAAELRETCREVLNYVAVEQDAKFETVASTLGRRVFAVLAPQQTDDCLFPNLADGPEMGARHPATMSA